MADQPGAPDRSSDPPSETPPAVPPTEAARPPRGPEPQRPRRLTRSRTDEVLGGVAGGLGNYLGVDPVLIRIAWVALVLFGGTGILLYIIAWVIIPEEPLADAEARRAAEPGTDASRHASAGTSGALILAVVLIAFGSIALLNSIDVNVPSWRVVFAGALGLVGIAILARARDGLHGGLVATGIVISVVLAASSGIHIGINIDADHAFGDHTAAPRGAADLEDDYGHAFGSFRLDLSEFDLTTLPPGTTRIEVDAAFGSVGIDHGGLPVRVETDSVFGSGEDFESSEYRDAERRILVEVSTAFGSSSVRR